MRQRRKDYEAELAVLLLARSGHDDSSAQGEHGAAVTGGSSQGNNRGYLWGLETPCNRYS